MLDDATRKAYTLQDYSRAPRIEGVDVIELKRFHDDGGSMTELGRLVAGAHRDMEGFEVRQVNYSELEPQAIKAFHVHQRQTDVWFVPPCDKVLLVLHDCRAGSKSEGVSMRLVLGDGSSRLVRIPPGVAHGCKNLAPTRGRIVYFTDLHFSQDPSACDEGRLPWDHLGASVWEVTRG